MSNNENGLPIEVILNKIISEIPIQDPLKYLDNMYDSCNPQLISWIVDKGKQEAQKLNNKKGTKEANIYFTMGNTNFNRAMFSGFFGGILWIEDYIRNKAYENDVSEDEIKTFSKVMRKMGLPQISNIKNDADKDDIQRYSVRTYDACLSNFVLWLSRGSMANSADAKHTRSNKEVIDTLTASSLSSFPAIPFTSFYLATVKTNDDILTLTERISKNVEFTKYVSNKFLDINEPKFVVATSNAPITNIINHPLVVNEYGIRNNNKIEWLAGFIQNEEFERICLKNSLSSDIVKKYILTTSEETLKRDIEQNKPIAKFIESQHVILQSFKNLKQASGLLGSDNLNNNYL